MTDITCKSTDCKYNSAKFQSDTTGTCMLQHIEVNNFLACITYEPDNTKPEYSVDKF